MPSALRPACLTIRLNRDRRAADLVFELTLEGKPRAVAVAPHDRN